MTEERIDHGRTIAHMIRAIDSAGVSLSCAAAAKALVPAIRSSLGRTQLIRSDAGEIKETHSVKRHNSLWTCYKCGYEEIVDEDREAERGSSNNAT